MPGERRPKPTRPFGERVDPHQPGRVGRRPPLPAVPLLSGAMWVVVGIFILVSFSAGWKYVVGAVCIGVGLLFLRGGLVAYLRQHRD